MNKKKLETKWIQKQQQQQKPGTKKKPTVEICCCYFCLVLFKYRKSWYAVGIVVFCCFISMYAFIYVHEYAWVLFKCVYVYVYVPKKLEVIAIKFLEIRLKAPVACN